MATFTVPRYLKHGTESTGELVTATCPPSSFPDKFQDFFTALTEDVDDLPSMLEDKLIPRKEDSNVDGKSKRWGKRAFQRRSSEVEVRLQGASFSGNQGQSALDGPRSPTPSRRRSSSIAVARPTPDLHRFLQAEAGPWGHLSPSSRSPTRTPALSPGALSTSHLGISPGNSPGGPSPTSPGGPSSSRVGPPKHRGRTSSMPAVPRHGPMLAELKRSGLTEDVDGVNVEYYKLRSFSITANGVCNLGDITKSRRSKSINSVASSGTSCSSTRDARLLSSASQISGIEIGDEEPSRPRVAAYKVGMLGEAGVGKTALTAQFTTSEYICAYDASLDDEYGQKSVSVMIDGQETELEIVDHPAQEMSVETFCSTYNPDVFVVVYSVVDRRTMKFAEATLYHLWESEYMSGHGVILVGNKVDLERKREVPAEEGRRLANSCGCKFIETSSGLAHQVDELLVGILAQIKLNPQRNRDQSNARRRRTKHRRKFLNHLLGFKRKTKSCENLFTL